jgi:hypothetical protein
MNTQTENNLIEQGCAVFANFQLKLNAAINAIEDDLDLAQFEQCIIHVNDWYRALRKSTRIATALEVKILELNDRMHELSRIKKNPIKIKSSFIAQIFGSSKQAGVGAAHIELLECLSRIKLLTIKISDDLKNTPEQPSLNLKETILINSYHQLA